MPSDFLSFQPSFSFWGALALGSILFAPTVFLHRRNKAKRTLYRFQKAKISAEVDNRKKPSECRDKRTLLELRDVALAGVGGCWKGSGQNFPDVLQMDLLTAKEG